MVRNGHYSAQIGTFLGQIGARLRLQDGTVSGRTSRGAVIKGTYSYDSARGLVRFSYACTMPPFHAAITGLVLGAASRTVTVQGEATPDAFSSRFSVDFAGRALDIKMLFVAPLESDQADLSRPPKSAVAALVA